MRISFSRDGVGHVFAIPLQHGQSIDVREHQFLAATDNVDFTFNWNKGAANILFGSVGFFIDTFTCMGGEGLLWLHGFGNVFEVVLQPAQQHWVVLDDQKGLSAHDRSGAGVRPTLPSALRLLKRFARAIRSRIPKGLVM